MPRNPTLALLKTLRKPDAPANQCTAHAKQTKLQCKQPAIPGGNVCVYHGGKAPQVINAARRRLLVLLEPALDKLEENIQSENVWASTKAIGQVLQFSGISEPEQHEHRHLVYDPAKYANLTDEELEHLAALAGKLMLGQPGGSPDEGA